uniref:RRM domain-containing protein n=1 Tax=Clastoptera arizonana TaxID=38151 RepID=A0A1B6E7N0_9HEMI
MLIKDTLLIRHFPSQLSHKEKEEFLTHFGAVDVQILGSENQKSNIIYAKYETETAAQIALKKLHQLEILDEILCVEIARGNKNCNNLHFPSQVQQLEKQSYLRKQQESFLQKINSWTKLVDLNYPPPAHLNYQYSPPTQQVLGNICKALSNVPKLYTQVLHLMNKMNLPCPFTDNYPLDTPFSLKKENMVYNQNNYHLIENFTDESCDEEESEIESDPENKNIFQNKVENFSLLKRKKTEIQFK